MRIGIHIYLMNIVQHFLPVSDPHSVRPTAPGLRSEDRHAREDGPFLPCRHPAQHRVHVSILSVRSTSNS